MAHAQSGKDKKAPVVCNYRVLNSDKKGNRSLKKIRSSEQKPREQGDGEDRSAVDLWFNEHRTVAFDTIPEADCRCQCYL